MEPVLFHGCTQEDLMALATSLPTTVSVRKGRAGGQCLSGLPEDEAVSSTFPSPFHLSKAKEGSVVSLSEVTGPATTGCQASRTGCLGFQIYNSNMVNNAFLHRVKYWDCNTWSSSIFSFFTIYVMHKFLWGFIFFVLKWNIWGAL